MAFEKQLDELKRREAMANKMGGEEKLARQYARGKLDVRERMRRLLDDNSFREIGKIAGKGQYDDNGDLIDFSPSNFIFGRGRINNAPVVATADDFTVRGGAGDASIHRKFIMAERMAHELKLPIIRMIDGTGGGGSIKALDDLGFTYVPFIPLWADVVKNLKTVPVVALALGPTAGLGAARMVASHYSIMVRGVAQIFTAGPAVVAGMGDGSEALDKEALGGADIHARNGVIDDEAESEDEAFAMARTFLSYLPPHVGARAERVETHDSPERRDETLLNAVPENPKHAYNMRRIVETVADHGSVFEIGRRWGRAAITALARLDGYPVAILAGDPTFLGGSWTAGTAEKVKRFVELAEQFRLPVVHLVDNPGFMIGLEAEKAATIRRGVETLNAIYDASVPWATIIVRNAFGVAGAAMSDDTRFQYRFAWPSGDWGSLPMAGGLEVAYKSELEKADDPAAELQKIKSRLEKVSSPFRTAEQFLIEDIIDPRETRPLLCEFAQLAQRSL
ncbi:acyl-CoA carboxylase subunit beta [Hyphococcus sp. DH-69]|uniref:acyl-CoA carboxylase subunit beta n=1 Tax=Hyphococcus formosus TaxID=3143534 RepID=UPI00398B3459